jgi:soluble lytic murein transglycosylase-like protein
MNKEDLQKIAVAAALNAGLDPALVCSICAHESEGWKQYAVRYEPAFYTRYISSMKGLTPTEMQLRATSFGLMQIMGQTAREQGFDGEFLTELFDPLNAVTQGCRKLKHCLELHNNDTTAALLSYNGGSNANYPQLVMIHYSDYAHLRGDGGKDASA